MTVVAPAGSALAYQNWEYEKPAAGGVVVGVDGSRESIHALNTAAAIARVRGWPLHAVTVLNPFPSYQINPGLDETRERVDRLRTSLKDSELNVIMTALEAPDDWTHEVVIGRPTRQLTMIAERRCAELIVMGRRKHGVMDRVLGSETTLQVMRTCRIPVLGVTEEIQRPKTVVVATDFSDASKTAVELAHALLCGAGTLFVVYVESGVTTAGESITDGERRYPGDVVVWFRRLMNELPVGSGTLTEPVVLSGNPVSGIIEFAEGAGADLIAAGSHGHNKLERFLLGSVSTALVREAQCGVLIAPPEY